MRAWPQAWLREGQQWLRCPSASNQYWLRYAGIDLSAEYDPSAVSEELAGRICEAFGLLRHARAVRRTTAAGPGRGRVAARFPLPDAHLGEPLRPSLGRGRGFR